MQIYEKRTRYTNYRLFFDTVKQRTGDAVKVLLYLPRTANTGFGGVGVVATRTGIHRSYQHEVGRIFYVEADTRYGYLAIFERLTQHFKHLTLKFGKLVEIEDTVMGQTDFSGLWIATTACHGYC